MAAIGPSQETTDMHGGNAEMNANDTTATAPASHGRATGNLPAGQAAP